LSVFFATEEEPNRRFDAVVS